MTGRGVCMTEKLTSKKHSLVRKLLFLAVIVVLSLAAGCSNNENKSSNNSSGNNKGSNNTGNGPTKEIKNINIGWSGDIITLDPPNAPSIIAIGTLFNLYETLVRYDFETSKVVPSIAESWEVSDDGKTFTFKLNPNAKFASGNPVTASDVKYSLDRVINFKGAAQGFILQSYLSENSVKVIDDHTVEIAIKNPAPAFLAALTAVSASILDSKVVEEHNNGDMGQGWLNNNIAGSGPFLIEDLQRGSHITLIRNPQYWGEAPSLEKVSIQFISESSQQAILLERGDLDIALNLLPNQIKKLESKGFNVSSGANPATYYVALNMAKEPFSNDKVRQAIKYAMDYDGIIEGILDGYGTRAGGVIAEGLIGYDPSLDTLYKTDIKKAKKLMGEAGYSDGFEMELYMVDAAIEGIGVPNENLGAKIQADLAQIGIKVKLIKQDVNTLFPAYREGKIPSLIWFFGPTFPDSDIIMSPHGDWNTQATTRVGFNNQEVTDLIVKARSETDPIVREQLYKDAQKIVAEVGPYVTLFRTKNTIVSNSNLKNVSWMPIWTIDLKMIK